MGWVRAGWVVALLCTGSGPAAGAPLCERPIPASLIEKLEREFPRYRQLEAGDFKANDLKWLLEEKSGTCFAVARGEFAGAGQEGFAFLLRGRSDESVLLVAAIEVASQWKLRSLPTWCSLKLPCYLEAAKPGRYEQDPSLDAKLEKGQVESLTTIHVGLETTVEIGAAETEAGRRLYEYRNGRWRFVEVR